MTLYATQAPVSFQAMLWAATHATTMRQGQCYRTRIQIPASFSFSPSSSCCTTTTSAGSPPASVAVVAGSTKNKMKKRVRLKTARRREQCRVNQARYRTKQIARDLTLSTTVEQLRDQLETLRAQRQRLDTRVRVCDTAQQNLLMLCQAMRCGLSPVDRSTPVSTAVRRRQLACAARIVHKDVRVGDAHGCTALLDQLERFSCFWGTLRMELCSMECVNVHDTATTLQSALRLGLTVMPQTLWQVFPHLLLASNHDLKHKLVGQRLECDVRAVTVFNADGRLVQIDWTIDFVGALLRFVSLHEAAVALQFARIEQGAFLLAEREEPVIRPRKIDRYTVPHFPGRRFAYSEVDASHTSR